ncbi:MAG: rhodanese-like domain-containing protein [Ruminococcaceae bacterium]|nr:rhodanese-like domain-containing protein [Oscillospiraceae bacterium]
MKKVKGLIIMLLIVLSLFGMTACNGENGKSSTYEQITAEQAKAIMDTETDYIIIDARTEEEFAEGHIENAILIPEYEIKDRAEKELPDKDALILVYCRSGRRSKIASEELVKLGYTNVKEFGGIIDWPYETVK